MSSFPFIMTSTWRSLDAYINNWTVTLKLLQFIYYSVYILDIKIVGRDIVRVSE